MSNALSTSNKVLRSFGLCSAAGCRRTKFTDLGSADIPDFMDSGKSLREGKGPLVVATLRKSCKPAKNASVAYALSLNTASDELGN